MSFFHPSTQSSLVFLFLKSLFSLVLLSQQQFYAAQLASMHISPAAKVAPLRLAPPSSSPISPSTPKYEKRPPSPGGHVKVRTSVRRR